MSLIALKEWAVAVKAMETGQQTVIFRKGGISEEHGRFELAHSQFLLYPAREHQKPELLKPEFLELLEVVRSDQVGQRVQINCRAEVVGYQLIRNIGQAVQIKRPHVWTQEFLEMRLAYKPGNPLYAIELRIELLPAPIVFTETTEQAGCKSWVRVDV